MHGNYVVKYATLDTNHTPTLILLLVPSKNKEKEKKILTTNFITPLSQVTRLH